MLLSLAITGLTTATLSLGLAIPRANDDRAAPYKDVSLDRRQFNETFRFDPANFTVATVRAAPPNWPAPLLNSNWTGISVDLNATVAYGIELIGQAAEAGAGLVAFPECWFPGYPKGYDEGDNGGWMITHAPDYALNSLELGSYEWNELIRAIKHAGIYVALGFSERYEDRIYMGQALISPEGEKLIHRHKLRPSGSERDLWSDGLLSTLDVVETPYGRWGMLECWEHFHPAMTYSMLAQSEDLHIGAWPMSPDDGTDDVAWRSGEVNMAAARVYATNSYAFTVVPAVGNSRIFHNGGQVVAEVKAAVPYDEQPLLFASVDTTAFAKVPYNSDGEQSWAILQQIKRSFPAYIPHEQGTLVPNRNVSVAAFTAAAEAYLAAH